jgi:hypothetical protein
METINPDLSNLVLQTYPAPIALAWRNYLRSSNKKEEHDRLLDLLEISAMYLATAFISQYRQDNDRNVDIEKELVKISNGTFGTWNRLIQLIAATRGLQSTTSVIRGFTECVQKKEQSIQFQRFIKEVSKIIGKESEPLPGKVTLNNFLDWCVTYRNEVAHAKPSPSEEVCRARVEWLAPAVVYFIEKIRITAELLFVYLEQALVDNEAVVAEVIQLSGWDFYTKAKRFPASNKVRTGNLYICDRETNEVSLRLLPILIYGKCPSCTYEPRVFIFRKAEVTEKVTEKGKVPDFCKNVDYTCPVCGKRWKVDQSATTAAFMEVLLAAEKGPERYHETDRIPDSAPLPVLLEVREPKAAVLPAEEKEIHPTSTVLGKKINRYVEQFMSLQSQKDNSRTRGLDQFGKDTYIDTLLDTKLKEKVLSGSVNLVVLTGNAGDGKTAFIQQVEEESKCRGAKDFVQTKYGSKFIFGGRDYQTIYDGSEDEAGKNNRQRLEEFFFEFRGLAPRLHDKVKIIAVNEGHLRDYIFSNEDYVWLGRQIHHFLAYEDFKLDPSLLIINLNQRSVVNNSFTSGESIFDRQLEKFLLPKFWEDCIVCSAQNKCPIKFNVDSLTNPEHGEQVRSRLKALYLISHYRSRQHITIRDLRASLAYILVNRQSCESTHEELEKGKYDDFIYRYYFNSAFGGVPEDEFLDHEQERVVSLLNQIDVAPVPNPHLDNLLGFTSPSSIGLFAEFTGRAPSDLELLEEKFASFHGNPPIEQSKSYHSSMRRKFFFESVESAALEAGYISWRDMLPFKSLSEFMSALKDPSTLFRVKENIIEAINVSEKIFNNLVVSDSLCIRTNTNSKSLIKAFSQIPKVKFICMVRNSGRLLTYIEYCPNTIIFQYDHDPNKVLELNLDLYELLVRIRSGYVPGGRELKDFYLNLLLFKNQLTALPSSSIILTEDEKSYFRLSKSGDQMLSIDIIG